NSSELYGFGVIINPSFYQSNFLKLLEWLNNNRANNKEIAELNQKNKDLENQIAELNQKNKDLENQNTDLNQKNKNLENQNTELNQKVKDLENQNAKLEQKNNALQNQIKDQENIFQKLKKVEQQVEQCLTVLRTEVNKDTTLDQKMNELVELCKEFGKELPNFRSKRKPFQTKMLKNKKKNDKTESSYKKMKLKHSKIDRCMDLLGIKELTYEQKIDNLLYECYTRREERKKQEKFDPRYSDYIIRKMQRCLFYLGDHAAYYNDREEKLLEEILEE
ncbi:13103_t:CDS:2, partial [Racocetra persica]